MSAAFDRLIQIMSRLRGKNGCPWDREQTHRSLLKYLKEESAEVALAVRRRDHENLREELGDLLLQIIFHARIAEEAGRFTINDVVRDLSKKLTRRHPHVFGKAKLRTAEDVVAKWDELKKREKALKAREIKKRRRR